MQIKPIKSKRDYTLALKEIQKLWDSKPNTTNGDNLEVLIILVKAYEEKHYSIDPPDPIEAIKFRMEQRGLKQVDLASMIGGKNRVSEVLSGKKSLTLKMIRNLHKGIGIPFESLINATGEQYVYRSGSKKM
jgi:HTH-type transcriptional regulator/antitoxin HigA